MGRGWRGVGRGRVEVERVWRGWVGVRKGVERGG